MTEPILLKKNRLIKELNNYNFYNSNDDSWTRAQRRKVQDLKNLRIVPGALTRPDVIEIDTQIDQVKSPNFTNFKTKYQNAVQNILKPVDQQAKNSTDIFVNAMPYGVNKTSLTNDIVMNPLASRGSFSDFMYLFKNLFPEDYEKVKRDDVNDKVFENAYGSLFDWQFIDPKSTGIGSVTNLYGLFDKYYNKNIPDPGSSMDVEGFYNDFMVMMGYSQFHVDKGGMESDLTALKFNSYFNDFYTLDYSYWFYNDPSNPNDFKIPDGSGYNGMDSYGVFFKSKDLLFSNTKDGVYNSYDPPFNNTTGQYNLNQKGFYIFKPNDEYVHLFLYRKVKNDTGLDIYVNNNNTSDLSTGFNTDINKFLMNYRTSNIVTGRSTFYASLGLAPRTPVNQGCIDLNALVSPPLAAPNQYLYNISSPTIISTVDQTVPIMQGAGKRKQKGGGTDSLFDITAGPGIYADRKMMDFDKLNFRNVLDEFYKKFTNVFDYDRNLLQKMKINQLPLFYGNKNDERKNIESRVRGTININFDDLRTSFLFSNVFSTQCRLLRHFINNLIACYKYIISNQIKSVKNTLTSEVSSIKNTSLLLGVTGSTAYFDKIEEGINQLVGSLRKIRDKLDVMTMVGTNRANKLNSMSLFFGISIHDDTIFGLANSVKSWLSKYLFLNRDGTINMQNFSNFLKWLSITDEPNPRSPVIANNYCLGGLPLLCRNSLINEKIWTLYWMMIDWRQNSNGFFDKNFQIFLKDELSFVTEAERKAKIDRLNVDIPENMLRQFLGINVPDQQKQNFVVTKLVPYFYNEQLNIANKIVVLSKGNSGKNTRNLNNIIRDALKKGALANASLSASTDVNKMLALFKVGIEYMNMRLRVIMGLDRYAMFVLNPVLRSKLEVQLKWINTRLRNLYDRLEYINKALFTNANAANVLGKVGINMSEVQQGKIVDSQQVARDVIYKEIPNPNYNKREWWEKKYYEFNQTLPAGFTYKLFVFAVRPSFTQLGKLSPVDIYLVDVFGAAIAEKETWAVNPGIKWFMPDLTKLNKGVTAPKRVWDESSAVVNLASYSSMSTVRDKLGKIIDIGATGKVQNMSNMIRGSVYAFQPAENVLSEPKLQKLYPIFLQGYDDVELVKIIRTHVKKEPIVTPYMVYTITDKIIGDPNLMREWCYNLIFSMPVNFTSPESRFTRDMQVPVDKYFVKTGLGGNALGLSKGGLIKGFYGEMATLAIPYLPHMGLGVGEKVNRNRLFETKLFGNFMSQYGVQNLFSENVGKI